MAKDSELKLEPVAAPVIKAVPVVYPFRVNGTERVYDIDEAHLGIMLSRNDLTYIGTIPLPKLKSNETAK